MDSKVCVNCGNKKAINSTDNRLVTESCGHVKCMRCLLQETTGCLACKNVDKGLKSLNQNEEDLRIDRNSNNEPERQQPRLGLTEQIVDLGGGLHTEVVLTVQEFVIQPVILEETEVNQSEDSGTENNNIVLTVEDYMVQPVTVAAEENQAPDQDHESENKKLKLDTAHVIVTKEGDSKWYLCTLCKRKFTARSQVTYHAYCKGVKKPFECKDCNMSFVTISHFKYHKQSKHASPTDKGQYKCDICDARFIQKSKLERHNLKHNKLKEYSCKECDIAFNNRASLRKHELVHLGKQPYSCPHCERRFRDSSNMKKHVRTKHSTAEKQKGSDKKTSQYVGRRYKCTSCPLAFHSRKDLRRHEVIHTGQKPFVCPILDFKCKQPSFRRRDNYNRHLRNTHGVAIPAAGELNGQNGKPPENETEQSQDEIQENANLKVLNPLPPLPEEVIQKHLYTETIDNGTEQVIGNGTKQIIDNEMVHQTIDNEQTAIDINQLEVQVLDVQVIDKEYVEPVVEKSVENPVLDKSYIIEANNARESVICTVRECRPESPEPAYVHKIKIAHTFSGHRDVCLPPIDTRKLVELVTLYPHEKEEPPRSLDMPPLMEKDVQTLKNILHDKPDKHAGDVPTVHWRKKRLAGEADNE